MLKYLLKKATVNGKLDEGKFVDLVKYTMESCLYGNAPDWYPEQYLNGVNSVISKLTTEPELVSMQHVGAYIDVPVVDGEPLFKSQSDLESVIYKINELDYCSLQIVNERYIISEFSGHIFSGRLSQATHGFEISDAEIAQAKVEFGNEYSTFFDYLKHIGLDIVVKFGIIQFEDFVN